MRVDKLPECVSDQMLLVLLDNDLSSNDEEDDDGLILAVDCHFISIAFDTRKNPRSRRLV